MPATEAVAEAIRHPCSRMGVPALDRLWVPTAAEVAEVEGRLRRLKQLRADHGSGIVGARLEDPWSYHRQYVGVLIEGRKLIYIHGFSERLPANRVTLSYPDDWRTGIVDWCDGGYSSWGALYDPVRATFLALRFNGLA